MYKVIFVALLLVLPVVLANSSPYQELYEVGKRASILEIVGALLKNPQTYKIGCQATCTVMAKWLSFLCPKACEVVLRIISGKDFDL